MSEAAEAYRHLARLPAPPLTAPERPLTPKENQAMTPRREISMMDADLGHLCALQHDDGYRELPPRKLAEAAIAGVQHKTIGLRNSSRRQREQYAARTNRDRELEVITMETGANGKGYCPSYTPGRPGSRSEVIVVSEDPQVDATPDMQPGAAPDAPVSPGIGRDVTLAEGRRLSGLVAGRLADQARRTTEAARARRVANTGGEPGVLDLTPLRELVSELTEELQKVRPRERIARALRQAADMIDPPIR